MLLLPMLFTDVQAPWTGLGQGSIPVIIGFCLVPNRQPGVVQKNKQKQPKFNY